VSFSRGKAAGRGVDHPSPSIAEVEEREDIMKREREKKPTRYNNKMFIINCSHPTTQRPTTATNHTQQNQRSTPDAVTHGLCSPEDGHNDARNMLRQKLIINV